MGKEVKYNKKLTQPYSLNNEYVHTSNANARIDRIDIVNSADSN